MGVSYTVLTSQAEGDILVCEEGLSFWGGVNSDTSKIQDSLHPQLGEILAGRIVMMPTSRGSCTGGGILLGLALSGRAPAALVFCKPENILTLGAVIADRMFGHKIPVIQLNEHDYSALAKQSHGVIHADRIEAGELRLSLETQEVRELTLTEADRKMLAGDEGEAVKVAMEVVVAIAGVQGAECLTDITRVHIDGCIYADPALLTFAEQMAAMGAKVRVPTTLNAISVDHANWREQGVDQEFGIAASKLADSYVSMGAQPSFTCAPYLLEKSPMQGEDVAWAESNAVVYANSVLGARTEKHPDMLDLCIALTGRAPKSGVYYCANRAAGCIVNVTQPENADDSFWPMLGWLLGETSPEQIPLVRGLENSSPSDDDLKALCAAFGTRSAAPMLHIAGITPEANMLPLPGARFEHVGLEDFSRVWRQFNSGGKAIDLVALGSPHFSTRESRAFLKALGGRRVSENVATIITLGRATRIELRQDGTEDALLAAGVKLVCDVCWCSITEPVFPPLARVLMTNSGKYAHYGPGLSGREVRFGSLEDCANTAVSGLAPVDPPDWISDGT